MENEKITSEQVFAECNQSVDLIANGEKIKGIKSYSHTGNNTNQILVEFTYDNRNFKYPFSRKTGKLYACKLDFDIRLILN